MIDFFTIFTKGGFVLVWYIQSGARNIKTSVNSLIKSVILQDKIVNPFQFENFSIKYVVDNEFELIYVVGYQNVLQLSFTDKFLSDISLEFRDKYKNDFLVLDKKLSTYSAFDEVIQRVLRSAEQSVTGAPKEMRSYFQSEKSKKTLASAMLNAGARGNAQPNGGGAADSGVKAGDSLASGSNSAGSKKQKKKGKNNAQAQQQQEETDDKLNGTSTLVESGVSDRASTPSPDVVSGGVIPPERLAKLAAARRRGAGGGSSGQTLSTAVLNGSATSSNSTAPPKKGKENRRWLGAPPTKEELAQLDHCNPPQSSSSAAGSDSIKNGEVALSREEMAELNRVRAEMAGKTNLQDIGVGDNEDDEEDEHSDEDKDDDPSQSAQNEKTKTTTCASKLSAATQSATVSGSNGGGGGMFGMFKKILSSAGALGVGVSGSNAPLQLEQLRPALEKLQEHLESKNVASEVAQNLCVRVQQELVGVQLGRFERIQTRVRRAMEDACTHLLMGSGRAGDAAADATGGGSASGGGSGGGSATNGNGAGGGGRGVGGAQQRDVLRDVLDANEQGRAYSIVFCGVNGVGKSTNLAKIAFWLIGKGLRVMIAACDTFRSGAVEQLRTHVKRIEYAYPPDEVTGQPRIALYEKGYGKDVASVAASAMREVKQRRFQVLMIDTAGRMQDNEPLMRSLANLIVMNRPDLVLFVGEALVGNESVDQLVKYNRALTVHTPAGQSPLSIDGIVLTKFDTIADKVGAAVSMTYISGRPILFVGTGQTYADLRQLSAGAVVKALMK